VRNEHIQLTKAGAMLRRTNLESNIACPIGTELDFRSSGCVFDSRPGCNQGTFVNSAFYPSWVGTSSTSLHRLGLKRGTGWPVTLCDLTW